MLELIFIHLPKTGGSSILETLIRIYGAEHVRHFERDECLELKQKGVKISEVLDPKVKVLHGHIQYSEISDLVERYSPKLVTFMREPSKRVISNYNWWQRTLADNPEHPRIDESLKVYITRPETQNKMARFMDGVPLGAFFFIGFLESFDEDLARLGNLLDWPQVPVFHEKNSKGTKKISAEAVNGRVLRKIQKLNQADWALYKQALTKFKSA